MINLLLTNLYTGSMFDLPLTDEKEWAFVHATQTVHYKILGWDKKEFLPGTGHPHYFLYEKDNHLSLNWAAGRKETYDQCGVRAFSKILDFMSKWIPVKKVLVHCDKGASRSPTVCLIYLSKRCSLIPDDSFESARDEFIKLYPEYIPDSIGEYVSKNWKKIR